MVKLVALRPGEIVQDPAAGTGGFLIAANHAIAVGRNEHDSLDDFQRRIALRGMEM